MPITHAKVSTVPDTADTEKIQPSDWNGDHVIDIFVDDEVPNGTTNGVNAVFTLDNTPVAGSVKVYINGVRMFSTVHYTISGSTITFETDYIPQTTDYIRVDYRKA